MQCVAQGTVVVEILAQSSGAERCRSHMMVMAYQKFQSSPNLCGWVQQYPEDWVFCDRGSRVSILTQPLGSKATLGAAREDVAWIGRR